MNQNDLTKGSIGKGILVFLLPLLASTLIQQLYNTVDLIFVGKFCGTEATAAVGASSLMITCLIGFFNGMAVGTNVVTSHIYGKKDDKGGKENKEGKDPKKYNSNSFHHRTYWWFNINYYRNVFCTSILKIYEYARIYLRYSYKLFKNIYIKYDICSYI